MTGLPWIISHVMLILSIPHWISLSAPCSFLISYFKAYRSDLEWKAFSSDDVILAFAMHWGSSQRIASFCVTPSERIRSLMDGSFSDLGLGIGEKKPPAYGSARLNWFRSVSTGRNYLARDIFWGCSSSKFQCTVLLPMKIDSGQYI